MENSTLYLAIYGSTISTIALIWNITRYVNERKGKLKITPSLNTKIPISNLRSEFQPYTSLDISVVNLSEKTRFVKQPQFELKQKSNKYMNFLDLNNPVNYPVELVAGKEFNVGFNLDSLEKEDLKRVVANKFRIRIVDTHGKEYKSKWYRTNEFGLKK